MSLQRSWRENKWNTSPETIGAMFIKLTLDSHWTTTSTIYLPFSSYTHSHSIKPLKILSSVSANTTEEIIVFDIVEIKYKTRVKLIEDNYKLKLLKDDIHLEIS